MLRSLCAFVCVVALSISSVHGQCQYAGYDLSSLQGQYAVVSEGPNESLYMSVCQALPANKNCGGAFPGASACFQVDVFETGQNALSVPDSATVEAKEASKDAPTYYVVGIWSGEQWSTMDNGIQYVLTGQPNCDDGAGGTINYQATVQFPCSEQAKAMTVTLNSNCAVTFVWATPLTCGGGGPPCTDCGNGDGGGLSGGAIAGIIITILVVIAACVVALWYLNKTGRLERIKATLNGQHSNQPLLNAQQP